LESTAAPILGSRGELLGYCGVDRDVTEQRQVEERLRQSQKMEAIGQLAGGVAHDFNNILSIIQGNAELALMKAEGADNERDEILGAVIDATERAASLTRQLLLFSREQAMEVRDIDLNEVVNSLTRMLERILDRRVELRLDLHPDPVKTSADPGMLDQVLMNLVLNARDAMPGGGQLVVGTSLRWVTEAEAEANPDAAPGPYVALTVADTGEGIPSEILPRIFEPFYSSKEPGKGTGLGLASVFGIVKRHAGWITVESEVGKGARFEVILPALGRDPVAQGAAEEPAPGGAMP
jgi:signal transduction histidine kinase